MITAIMRMLLPRPTETVAVEAAYGDPARGRRDGRPWVLVNMIASADGAITIDERSGGLGGPGDRAIFHHLRSLADLILVGAGTVRAEGYRPPRKPGQRIAVVTASGDLDYTSPLFTSGAGLVVTTHACRDLPVDTVRAGQDTVDLGAALRRLDCDVVLCEGGPRLNGDLLHAGCIDELCLTTSPVLVGGVAGRAVFGGAAMPTPLELVHLLEENGFLFARYLVRSAPTPPRS